MKRVLSLWLLVCGIACANDARPLSGSAEIHWRQFTGMIQAKPAKKVLIYIGTPRRSHTDPKPAEPTIKISDFEFYLKPHEANLELAEKLTKLVSDPHSFSEYGGMKFCGGFHPDLCVEWQFEQEGQSWHSRAFVCLGCHEWRLIDQFSAVHTNMRKGAADELARIARSLESVSQKK